MVIDLVIKGFVSAAIANVTLAQKMGFGKVMD